MNKSDPLRFLQLWILPRHGGLDPKYGSFSGKSKDAIEARTNKWAHMVTGTDRKAITSEVPIRLDQDVNIFIAEVDDGVSLDFKVGPNRQAYVVNAEGETFLSGKGKEKSFDYDMISGDAAEAYGEVELTFNSKSKGFWVVVEMAWSGGKSHVRS